MANRDNPHGFRPLMRTLSGGPGAAMLGAHKLVGYGTALYIHDLITRVASGTKYTSAISAAITPGTTVISGVNMTYGAASTATDHQIIPAAGYQVFEAQDNKSTDGIGVADINKNANAELNAGNTVTKISGHEINESTIAVTNTLDLKIVGIFRSPDNLIDASGWVRAEVIINRVSYADQVAGL
jgi:hypothetical protein